MRKRKPSTPPQPTVVKIPAAIVSHAEHHLVLMWGHTDDSKTFFHHKGRELPKGDFFRENPVAAYPCYRVVSLLGSFETVAEALAALNSRYVQATYAELHMPQGVYGGEAMQAAARAFFEAHSELQFVLVHEHGGWHLGYRRDLTIWCTANDQATLSVPYPQPALGIARPVSAEQETA